MLTIIAFVMGFAATPRTPNACEVLSPRDIARVQGARSTSTKLTEHDAHDMKVSQCFYALPHLSDSVTVDLIRGDVRAFWKHHLDEEERENKPVANRSRTAEPETRIRHVEGVGEDAVWSGNRLAGALYVLKGETIVRVSVGGNGSEEQKIEKAKALAARAIRRL